MQSPVEIRYAGVVVTRASEVRADGPRLFLVVPDPLPVGTVIGLGPENRPARVEKIEETADAARAGMLVCPISEQEAAEPFAAVETSPAALAEPEPPPEPLPEVVSLVQPTEAPVAMASSAAPAEPEPRLSSEIPAESDQPSERAEPAPESQGGNGVSYDLPPAKPLPAPEGRRGRRTTKRRR